MNQSRFRRVVSLAFTTTLFLIVTPLYAASLTFSGTVTNILVDTGGGVYAGLTVGQSLSGNYIYGNTSAQATSIFTEPNEADWEFTGGGFGGSVTDGVSTVTSSRVNVNIQNDFPVDTTSASLINLLASSPISVGTPIDVWSASATEDGAFFMAAPTPDDPDNEMLVNGAIFDVFYLSLDASLYSGLGYQPNPPGIGAVDVAGFIIEEADSAGNTVLLALGTLDNSV